MQIKRVMIVLLLSLLISGCSLEGLQGSSVVTVQPASGAVLSKAKPFRVYSVIKVDYEISSIEIVLSDLQAQVLQKWSIPVPPGATTFLLDQELQLHANVPPGKDYRLEVSALPAAGAIPAGAISAGAIPAGAIPVGQVFVAYGYSTIVEVAP